MEDFFWFVWVVVQQGIEQQVGDGGVEYCVDWYYFWQLVVGGGVVGDGEDCCLVDCLDVCVGVLVVVLVVIQVVGDDYFVDGWDGGGEEGQLVDEVVVQLECGEGVEGVVEYCQEVVGEVGDVGEVEVGGIQCVVVGGLDVQVEDQDCWDQQVLGDYYVGDV